MGTRAVSESFLTRSGGDWSVMVTGTVAVLLPLPDEVAVAVVSVLARLAGGEVGGDLVMVSAVMIFLRGESVQDGRYLGGALTSLASGDNV